MNKKYINQLKKYLLKNGGATLDPQLKVLNLKTGYCVSLKNTETQTTIKDLKADTIKKYQAAAQKNNCYVGLWLDNNILYIDLSINIKDKNRALNVAKNNNQLAIYDCKNSDSIYL